MREFLLAAAQSRPVPLGAPGQTEVAIIRSVAMPTENGVPPRDVLLNLVGAYRVNQFVRGRGANTIAQEALRGFERFLIWMWRNTVVVDFVGWLCERNDRLGGDEWGKAGFYGLDLYSLYRSMHEVVSYLERVDPAAVVRARQRYSCFDHYKYKADDGQAYGLAAAFGVGETCEQQVLDQLIDLQRHGKQYLRGDGLLAEDELFYAEQNAKTVKDAAQYYRSMSQWTRSALEPARPTHGRHPGGAQRPSEPAAGRAGIEELSHEVGEKEFFLAWCRHHCPR